VEVDRTQFERVLLNLAVNASDAMPRGGSITLRTFNTTHESIEPATFVPVPGRYVCIAVRDTGAGMDDATRERVFDPFFTTKEPGEGSGLGLATVYGIVKGHEGYVEVETSPGEGSEFRVFLPASHREVEAAATPPPALLRPGSGSILVVDDEADVLSVIEDLLLELGYEVTTAGSGAEAIALYNSASRGFDLVILDMVMPGMGGDEVFEALRRIDPDVKVLLASGYARGGKARDLLEQGCAGFLEKPFLFEELSEKVEELIAAAG
jgi:CheY-like chemotaxis protein